MLGFYQHESRTSLPVVSRTHALPQCGKCKLDQGCKSPKMKVAGRGRRKLMIVGEASGATEDERGLPFVGPAGQRLQRDLKRYGIDIFEDCWVVNALRCHPPQNKIKDRRAVDYCRPLTLGDITRLRPKAVLLLGATAVESVIGHAFRSDRGVGGIGRWAGYRIPYRDWNCWLLPAHHPSWLLRVGKQHRSGTDPVADTEFATQVEAFAAVKERPWDEERWNPQDRVTVCVGDDDAVNVLRTLRADRMVAFDYETTTAKPYGPHAEIVCCAVSDGRRSVAFPWAGRAKRQCIKILTDPDVKKIIQNSKFEVQWSRAVGGFDVRGVAWDTMTSAHALDGRTGVTGLEFLCFTELGLSSHKADVAPFLKSKTPGGPNRVKEVPLRRLLAYCGEDALLEWMVARKQVSKFQSPDP